MARMPVNPAVPPSTNASSKPPSVIFQPRVSIRKERAAVAVFPPYLLLPPCQFTFVFGFSSLVFINKLDQNKVGKVTPLKQFMPFVIAAKDTCGNVSSDEQFCHALLKFVPLDVSIKGNEVSDEQPFHAPLKFVPLLVSIKGNEVSDEHPCHVVEKLIPLDVSIEGNEVSDIQLRHAKPNSVPLDVSINANEVSDEQPRHALPKFVPLDVSINGNAVSDEQLNHAAPKFVPLDVSISGNEVSDEQSRHPLAKLSTAPLSGKSAAVIRRFEQPLYAPENVLQTGSPQF